MGDTITVHQEDSVWLYIITDPGIEHELASFFEFYVEGYQFMPAYRNKMWDGKIRLFNRMKKSLYAGLYEHLEVFARDRDYFLIDKRAPETEVDAEDINRWLSKQVVSAHGQTIEIRDYQAKAVVEFLSNKRRMIVSPTASGKSLIIYLATKWFLEQNKKMNALIVVPTTSLVSQMRKDFEDYHSQQKDSLDIHEIMGGREKRNDARITISTWQSIYKKPAEWFERFGFVIGDEAHQFKAKSLTSVMEKMANAEFRAGTTGTLDGTMVNELVLVGLFGPVYKVITTKELIDAKALADLRIKMMSLEHTPENIKKLRKKKYQEEIAYLVSSNARNNFIKNLTVSLEGNTLVLFNLVEKHGKPLKKLIEEATDKQVFYVSGEVSAEEREAIRAITDANSDMVTLHFGDKTVKVASSEMVQLENAKSKRADRITKRDNVSDEWIINNAK